MKKHGSIDYQIQKLSGVSYVRLMKQWCEVYCIIEDEPKWKLFVSSGKSYSKKPDGGKYDNMYSLKVP